MRAPRSDRKVQIAAVVALAAFLGLALWHPAFLMLGFASALMGVALHGAARALSRRLKIGERWSLVAVLVGLLLVTAGSYAAMGASAIQQYDEVRETLPAAASQAMDYLSSQPWSAPLVANIPPVSELSEELMRFRSSIMTAINSVSTAISGALIALIVGIYLAWQPDLYARGVERLFPRDMRGSAREVLERVAARLRSWLVGRCLSMAAVGVLTGLTMWIMDIPMPLALGLFAGVMAFVPYVGPILSAVPAILLGFTESPMMALYVGLAYAVIQQVEGNLITPMIQQEKASVPPALLLLGQVLAASLFGFVGVLFSTPLLVVTMVLVQVVYIEKVLGEGQDDLGAPRAEDVDPADSGVIVVAMR